VRREVQHAVARRVNSSGAVDRLSALERVGFLRRGDRDRQHDDDGRGGACVTALSARTIDLPQMRRAKSAEHGDDDRGGPQYEGWNGERECQENRDEPERQRRHGDERRGARQPTHGRARIPPAGHAAL